MGFCEQIVEGDLEIQVFVLDEALPGDDFVFLRFLGRDVPVRDHMSYSLRGLKKFFRFQLHIRLDDGISMDAEMLCQGSFRRQYKAIGDLSLDDHLFYLVHDL